MITILYHIFFYDIWFYISHILLHHPKLYFIHKTHHKAYYKTLKYYNAYDGHIVESIIQSSGIFIPFLFQPITIVDFMIAIIFVNIRGLMRHDHRCIWIIGDHHLLHHKYRNYNYGEYWIDKLCGTIKYN
jgi:sterol desaturase/sphingolipid hydroxylase (fatty acid hydroxylase superfamily)